MTSKVSAHQLTVRDLAIRDLKTIDDLSQLKAVEKEVWGMSDEDTVPLTLAIALNAGGNIFVGAFVDGEPEQKTKGKHGKKEQLVGFAFGFLARERGEATIHSHMLAVLDRYRHLDLGSRLKQAQRQRALALGIREMTWTFDPLQSRNAHFNFAKLGVVSDTYKIDFYGPETSSILHRNGTDRLWVRWMLNSRRVRDRLSGRPVGGSPSPNPDLNSISISKKDPRAETLDTLKLLAPLLRFDPSGKPARADLAEAISRQRLSIEIPSDILDVERADMGLAREWREATRWAFCEALKAGFFVVEFSRAVRGQQGPGTYLLERGRIDEMEASP